MHCTDSLLSAARRVSAGAAERAAGQDHDGGFPDEDVRALAEAGLLAAPVPVESGGSGLVEPDGASRLLDVLRLVGRGSLALGRVYEGHVNALALIARYGTVEQRAAWFADARDGHLFGVWNTEAPDRGLRIGPGEGKAIRLSGGKTYASGAGWVTRALVTARREPGDPPQMVVVPLESGSRADLSGWVAHGMRASATGTVDLDNLLLAPGVLLGGSDDYHRQPFFSGGAWRFLAVQLGGIEAVFDAWRDHIGSAGRGADLHQLARLGQGATALETARLWVERAARIASAATGDADAVVAYVNLARGAVERAGLDILELAGRSVGLQGYLRTHPLERLSRDLATYLRQPAPDRALVVAAATLLPMRAAAGDLWRP